MNQPADAGPSRWLRWYRKAARPRMRLVCLPHAGGAASMFRDWPQWLPEDVEVIGVCYPGRQDRVLEPCIDEMGVLSTRIADVLQCYAGERLALFGHSMGASVAYEVALRLQQRTGRAPVGRLFVSGQLPPHRVTPDDVHLRGDDAIQETVRGLGDPNADAVLDDPDLRELVMPAIRADFRLIGTYLPRPATALDTSVTAYAGADDEDVPAEGLKEWAATTAPGRFDHRVYPGGHFYLLDEPEVLVRDLADHLAAASATR
ncbi:alpha/beta fold hydrolase [Streptomyces sp. NPDC005925]|uniref:thioesterase II family protein n=1 Tax=Streptomyces sp. NPDC005925 TaxID=3157172 RepID=UPI0034009D39